MVLPQGGFMTKAMSAESLAENYILERILNGFYKPLQYLEPERELAILLSLSRPVIHKAIIRLEAKGVVTIVPRKGIRVNDYTESGKLSLLEHLYPLERGKYPVLNKAMLQFLISNLKATLYEVNHLSLERKSVLINQLSGLEIFEGSHLFAWVKMLARAIDNPIYPMLFNEFEIGVVNVGKAIIAHSGKGSVVSWLKAIEMAVLEGTDEKEINQAVDGFYEKVIYAWLSIDLHFNGLQIR